MRPLTQVHAHDEGLAGTALVVIIAWALAAVLMLTGTLVSAQQIDSAVADITGTVSEIDTDTDAVELTQETNRIAADILAAAEPLSGQLDQVIASAGNIDGTVKEILSTAGEINTTVKDINGVAKNIGGTVNSIHGNVSGILSLVKTIDAGVDDINRRADVIVSLVHAIKSDTGNILTEVGTTRSGSSSIILHANSIDCSPAVRARSSACQN